MRTTIDIPDSLFREVKASAARQGLSLKDFFATAALAVLRESSDRPRMTSPPVARHRPVPGRTNRELAILLAKDEGLKAR